MTTFLMINNYYTSIHTRGTTGGAFAGTKTKGQNANDVGINVTEMCFVSDGSK